MSHLDDSFSQRLCLVETEPGVFMVDIEVKVPPRIAMYACVIKLKGVITFPADVDPFGDDLVVLKINQKMPAKVAMDIVEAIWGWQYPLGPVGRGLTREQTLNTRGAGEP